MIIKKVSARQIPDVTGKPTIECTLNGTKASVPSGTSAGEHEAKPLDAKKAVENVNNIIAKKLAGKEFSSQEELDNLLLRIDGTKNKSRLGANAILSVSVAFCKAHVKENGMEAYEYISSLSKTRMAMPVPQFNLINGGRHAGLEHDIQENMIMPVGAKSFKEALHMGKNVYSVLRDIVKKKHVIKFGLEHGFIVKAGIEERLDMIISAIDECGYNEKIKLALDCAASEFYSKGSYVLGGRKFDTDGLIDYYSRLTATYNIISIEDGLNENDFAGWKKMKRLGIQVVGDDLLATNTARIKKAALHKSCNAMILKPNQAGTVSEAIDAAILARKNKWNVIVSHRSRETKDTFIADMAVIGNQCKFGAPAKDRILKYNRLLHIERKSRSKYARFK